MKAKNFIVATTLMVCTDFLCTCKKNFDETPVKKIPMGGFYTIAGLKNLYLAQKKGIKFMNDASVYLTITMDETSGNIYRQVYARDSAGRGICVKLLVSGGLYQGDFIRLNLKGSTIDMAYNQLQIDSVDTDIQVVKISTGNITAPRSVTIKQIDTSFESQLVSISNIEFMDVCKGKTFADVVNQKNTNYQLHECGLGDYIMAYTSSYANFAGQVIPFANGSVVAIAQRYNNTMELIFRSWQEIKLNNSPCGDAIDTLTQNFNSSASGQNLNLGGWHNINECGSEFWQSYPRNATIGSNLYAHCSSFFSTSSEDTAWLISPRLKYNPNKKLNFQSAISYWKADQLAVLVSNDFNGINLSGSHWTDIRSNFSIATSGSGNNVFVNSGVIPLAPFLANGHDFYIGFRYWGSKQGNITTDYFIDNINIKN